MRNVIAVLTAISLALGIASPANAFEGGGRKPSEAPLIAIGQHYVGQLNNHANDANFGGNREVAIWRLPPLTTRDVVTVNWHSVPFTNDSGSFPVCLYLAQGIDDYNWGTVAGETVGYRSCYQEGPVYSLSGSGTAQTSITVQETNATSSYLEFTSYANRETPTSLETYPYDFTVEPIHHYLGLALRPVQRVAANGALYATANLANGSPAPDGLGFNLNVTWSGGGSASYTGTSSGGTIGFQLALPETAQGKQAKFVVSHPADAEYQAVTSPDLQAMVAKSNIAVPAVSACTLATRHAQSLARQFKRVKRNASFARGRARRRLRHRARRVGNELRVARLKASQACP